MFLRQALRNMLPAMTPLDIPQCAKMCRHPTVVLFTVPPIDYDPIEPPHRLSLLQELRLPLDALGWVPGLLARGRPVDARQRRSVVLLPGFGTGPRSMRVMETFLRKRGHHVRDWGLGLNTGEAGKLRSQLGPILQQHIDAHGGPAVLVGWSLGGYLAREYAREHPQQVRKVVTLGSPVIGGPRYTVTARHYRSQGHDLEQIEQAVKQRYSTRLDVPVAALYSKRDGIVAWPACIDRWSANVRHHEVDATHVGLIVAPRVLELVAREVEDS